MLSENSDSSKLIQVSWKEEKEILKLFRAQVRLNMVYADFMKYLRKDPNDISRIVDIPFLPVGFFKTHDIICGSWVPELIFQSSGTTGMIRSKHLIKSKALYHHNTKLIFEQVFGSLEEWIFVAYLPGYTENPESSLISMVQYFITETQNQKSQFISFDSEHLKLKLEGLPSCGKKILLIGVSHALYDFGMKHKLNLPELTVMETGGMKLSGQVVPRSVLHEMIKSGFGTSRIVGEYGMTELLSQAYSTEEGLYQMNDRFKVLIADPTDPFCFFPMGRLGVLNIIDLANESSCSFIATQDIGRTVSPGVFEVIGRVEGAEARGCNMLYA